MRSAMVDPYHSTVVSCIGCPMSIVICNHCVTSNRSAVICDRMCPTLKSSGMNHFGAKFEKEFSQFTDVSQVFTRSWRDMRLFYAKEMVSISSAV